MRRDETDACPSVAEEIQTYVRTGDSDIVAAAWPGGLLERATAAKADLRGALVAEVERREAGRPLPADPGPDGLVELVRDRVEPMVRGLFPRVEQQTVLAVLERAFVFLTPGRVRSVLLETRWNRTAWDLANLYLGSTGADLLDREDDGILGLSEETTCYVSCRYLSRQRGFDDWVVHEAAHVFHNCKRGTLGLRQTRTREWLLDVEFRKRETFAYACEAYARLCEIEPRPAARRGLLVKLAAGPLPDGGQVDRDEYLDVLRDALEARNGWKRILARCAPVRRPSGPAPATAERGV